MMLMFQLSYSEGCDCQHFAFAVLYIHSRRSPMNRIKCGSGCVTELLPLFTSTLLSLTHVLSHCRGVNPVCVRLFTEDYAQRQKIPTFFEISALTHIFASCTPLNMQIHYELCQFNIKDNAWCGFWRWPCFHPNWLQSDYETGWTLILQASVASKACVTMLILLLINVIVSGHRLWSVCVEHDRMLSAC